MGTPSARSLETIFSARCSRSVRMRVRSAARRGSAGSKRYASMCNAIDGSTPNHRQDSSAPRTRRRLPGRAAAASPHPPVVSWSVIAMTSRPAAAPALTSSAGVNVPSLAVEWQWRSMRVTRERYPPARKRSGVVAVAVLAETRLDGLRLVHLLDHAQIQLVRVGQVLDLAQRLVLTGRLEHERAVAQHPAERRLLVLHVGDPQQRHHRDLAGDDAVDDHHPLVGQDEAVELPRDHPTRDPADPGKPDKYGHGDQAVDVLPGQVAGQVSQSEGG